MRTCPLPGARASSTASLHGVATPRRATGHGLPDHDGAGCGLARADPYGGAVGDPQRRGLRRCRGDLAGADVDRPRPGPGGAPRSEDEAVARGETQVPVHAVGGPTVPVPCTCHRSGPDQRHGTQPEQEPVSGQSRGWSLSHVDGPVSARFQRPPCPASRWSRCMSPAQIEPGGGSGERDRAGVRRRWPGQGDQDACTGSRHHRPRSPAM
jgi:hypothetical protein